MRGKIDKLKNDFVKSIKAHSNILFSIKFQVYTVFGL